MTNRLYPEIAKPFRAYNSHVWAWQYHKLNKAVECGHITEFQKRVIINTHYGKLGNRYV